MTDPELFINWMQRLNLSNSRAAKALGVDISTVKRIKRGMIPLPLERRLAMTTVLENLQPYHANYCIHIAFRNVTPSRQA